MGREIIEDEQGKLVKSLMGRTVIAAEFYDANPDQDWTEHEIAELVLDDGRVICFGGWGYDAYGATVWERKRDDD